MPRGARSRSSGSRAAPADIARLAGDLVGALREAGDTLSVAESCTGGLLGGAITSVPGASEVFRGGAIAYADTAKRALLGVDPAVIERRGAVSEATARHMAVGIRRRLGSTWAVAITGVAGPGGGTEEKPVGTVWLAVDGPVAEARRFQFVGDRVAVREAAVQAALQALLAAIGAAAAAAPAPAGHAETSADRPG